VYALSIPIELKSLLMGKKKAAYAAFKSSAVFPRHKPILGYALA
jgi:hypothetical protein